MLVLSRKKEEAIVIGDQVKVTVLEIRGNRVRLGIEAPHSVCVQRHELCWQEHEFCTTEKPVGSGGEREHVGGAHELVLSS